MYYNQENSKYHFSNLLHKRWRVLYRWALQSQIMRILYREKYIQTLIHWSHRIHRGYHLLFRVERLDLMVLKSKLLLNPFKRNHQPVRSPQQIPCHQKITCLWLNYGMKSSRSLMNLFIRLFQSIRRLDGCRNSCGMSMLPRKKISMSSLLDRHNSSKKL